MMLALKLSVRRGWVGEDQIAVLADWLSAVGLPVDPPNNMSVDTWLDHMGRDKKVVNGRLRLVLLESIGKAVIADDVSPEELSDFLVPFSAA